MNNYYQSITNPNSTARKLLSFKYAKNTSDKLNKASKKALSDFNKKHRNKFQKYLSQGLDYKLENVDIKNMFPKKEKTKLYLRKLGIKDNDLNLDTDEQDDDEILLNEDNIDYSCEIDEQTVTNTSKKGRNRRVNSSKKGRNRENESDSSNCLAAYS